MRTYVGSQEVVNDFELGELAHGFDELPSDDIRDLFLGVPGESHDDREAREAVAIEVLAELLELMEEDSTSKTNALYAAQLSCVSHRHRHNGRILRMGKAA